MLVAKQGEGTDFWLWCPNGRIRKDRDHSLEIIIDPSYLCSCLNLQVY